MPTMPGMTASPLRSRTAVPSAGAASAPGGIAEILPFSPLADEAPPELADSCWLPGGYPELHAGTLAANTNFLEGVRSFAAKKPVHGECGGFMVLGEALEDASGETHRMLGLLGHSTSFASRKMNLGYREARLRSDCPLGGRRSRFACLECGSVGRALSVNPTPT